jgi:hypothetical protein
MSDTPSMYVQVTRAGLAALRAENAALRESAKAAERKGMEKTLEIVRKQHSCATGGHQMYYTGFASGKEKIEAAIRAAMED